MGGVGRRGDGGRAGARRVCRARWKVDRARRHRRGCRGDRHPCDATSVSSSTNIARLGHPASMVVADGTAPPFRAGTFDAVLIDAPCSGLGALRRRADARWRVEPADVDALAALQRRLLVAGATLVAAGRPAGLQRVHTHGAGVGGARDPRRVRRRRADRRAGRGAPTGTGGGCSRTRPTPTG